jgi:hypothetical protein
MQRTEVHLKSLFAGREDAVKRRKTKPSDPSKNHEGSATRKFNPKGCATRLVQPRLTTFASPKSVGLKKLLGGKGFEPLASLIYNVH